MVALFGTRTVNMLVAVAAQIAEGMHCCCYVLCHPPQVYTQIKDQAHMASVVTEYLSDLNATSKKPMHLVVFQVCSAHTQFRWW